MLSELFLRLIGAATHCGWKVCLWLSPIRPSSLKVIVRTPSDRRLLTPYNVNPHLQPNDKSCGGCTDIWSQPSPQGSCGPLLHNRDTRLFEGNPTVCPGVDRRKS